MNIKKSLLNSALVFTLVVLNSCKPKNKHTPIIYNRSICTVYDECRLTKKQTTLQGKAGFSGVTDTKKEVGKEFSNKVLLYFKKGKQPYGCISDNEINDKELLENVKEAGLHMIVISDLKIAKVFDVPILKLAEGGYIIEKDYLFVIDNAVIQRVYKNICERQIISLLQKRSLYY